MATWAEVQGYVHSNYQVSREPNDEMLGLLFDTGEGRSQMVYVHHVFGHGHEWVRVVSLVGELTDVELNFAMAISASFVGASLQMTGDSLAVVNYQLLATIDAPEIDLSLTIVAMGADALEEATRQSDEH